MNISDYTVLSSGQNWDQSTNQSVVCCATTLFNNKGVETTDLIGLFAQNLCVLIQKNLLMHYCLFLICEVYSCHSVNY